MTAGDAPSTPHGIEVGGRGQGWVRSRAMSRCRPPKDRAPAGDLAMADARDRR